jgi:hypothetical protein
MKFPSVNEVINGFEQPTIEPVYGEPTYATINAIQSASTPKPYR